MAYQAVLSPLGVKIKDAFIRIDSIHISDAASFHTARLQNLKNESEGKRYLIENLTRAKYISDCYVDRIKKTGHLMQIDDLYILASMDKHSVFYVSSHMDDFHIVGSIEESVIIVDEVEVDVSSIQIGSYFTEKAMTRFNLKQEEVRPFFIDIITNGRYICVTHDHDSKKPARLFCKDRKLAYVTLDFSAAITAYQAPGNGDNIHQSVSDKIADMLTNEIKRMNDKERAISESHKRQELLNNIRLSEIDFELYERKGEDPGNKIHQEKEELQKQNRSLKAEWESLVDDVRRHAIALSAFI
jgi:hypothetical protein